MTLTFEEAKLIDELLSKAGFTRDSAATVAALDIKLKEFLKDSPGA